MVMVELIFFYDMMLTFMTTIGKPGQGGVEKKEKSFSVIAGNYLRGEFIYDFIALIPF